MTGSGDPAATATGGERGALRGATVLAGIGAGATALLAVGHAGVEIPLVSGLGPGGDRAVWPAAIAFGVAAVAYLTVLVGLARGRSWAVPAGAVVFAVTLVGSVTPYRGPASLLGALMGAAGVALLATAAVLRRRPSAGRRRTA